MNIAVLTIGDELCIGQIINLNAAWIASACTHIGGIITCHSTINDKPKSLIQELDRLRSFNSFIIITGGLGPTHDDSTKSTLASYFQDTFIEHNDTLLYLQERAKARGIPLSERNREQAMVPTHCTVLLNTRGTAPGLLFKQDACSFIALPGVPAEMKGIMNDHVLPLLIQESVATTSLKPWYRTLITKGITESNLADRIGNPSHFLCEGESLAFLPSLYGVRLRLGVLYSEHSDAQNRLDELEHILIEKAGSYIFAKGDETLLSKTVDLLIKTGKTLGLVESCTGGKLGAVCTELPGSSAFFKGGFLTYSNDLKVSLVHVKQSTLDTYGSVSEQTSKEMAEGGRHILNTDFCISITGIAGPDGGSKIKPVGLVWIGLSSVNRTFAKQYIFGLDREMNRDRFVSAALSVLYDEMTGS